MREGKRWVRAAMEDQGRRVSSSLRSVMCAKDLRQRVCSAGVRVVSRKRFPLWSSACLE